MNRALASCKRLARIGAFILVAYFLLTARPAFAQYGAGQYGTTSTTPNDLNVNKMVRTPLPPFNFVENLGENDLSYSPDTDVVFQLQITNSGNQTFEEVNVRDTLPDNIVSARVAPELNGEFSKPILFFVLKNVQAGETRTVQVTAHIAKQQDITPADQSEICEVNNVTVTSEDRSDSDSASFCIRKNVLGVTTLPKAGMEDYLPLLPFLAMGAIGMTLIIKPNFKKA